MCPMRVFLVLFSAMLACYLAWRNYSSGEELSVFSNESVEQSEGSTAAADKVAAKPKQISSKVSSGFWTLVDMASGRYLWKGMKSLEGVGEKKAAW